MKNLIIIFILLFSTPSFAFKNKFFKMLSPEGWFENPNYLGMDVVYFSPYKPNREQPVLMLMTHKKTTEFKNAKEFLLKQIELHKTNFKSNNNTTYRLVSEGQIKSKGHFAKVEFTRGKEVFNEYFALFPNKENLHVLLFSSPKDYFVDYWGDVSKTLNSFEISE